MKKKHVYSLVAAVSVVGVLAVTGLVSNANESEVKEYTDKHGNRVVEYVNPVDPGNEPAAPVEEHPLSMGQVKGDLMTVEETPVAQEEQVVTQDDTVNTPSEEGSVATTQIEPSSEGIVPDIATNVRYYTDKYGNKVTEYINPVDPGNQPATMPDTVPSTEGNVQGNIMTLDEPIID